MIYAMIILKKMKILNAKEQIIEENFVMNVKKLFFGRGDNECSIIENCKFSETPIKCTECIIFYCLDKKEQKCYDNDFLEN